jgi:hypothetical protein
MCGWGLGVGGHCGCVRVRLSTVCDTILIAEKPKEYMVKERRGVHCDAHRAERRVEICRVGVVPISALPIRFDRRVPELPARAIVCVCV